MVKRYQEWAEANPLLDWTVSVAAGLVVFLGLFLILPGPKTAGFAMLLVVIVLSSPTAGLLRRFSDERRQAQPISAPQEHGVGVLALMTSVLGIGAFALCFLGNRWDWPIDRIEASLAAIEGADIEALKSSAA